MENLLKEMSPSARKKYFRYGKIPVNLRNKVPKKINLKQESVMAIRSFFNQRSHQYFWENLELYSDYKKKNA